MPWFPTGTYPCMTDLECLNACCLTVPTQFPPRLEEVHTPLPWQEWDCNFSSQQSCKGSLFDDLHHALDEIPPEESCIILGDFNAHVGSRSGDDDLWRDVRGSFGLGEENEAGKEFLTFLLLNEATIGNTQFAKKAHTHANEAALKVQKMARIDFAVMCRRTGRGAMMQQSWEEPNVTLTTSCCASRWG